MIITRTPYRLSFFGGGTDYNPWFEKNSGLIIAVGLAHYCYLTVRSLPPFFDHRSRIVYGKEENVMNNHDIIHPSVRGCLKYMKIKEGVEIHHDGDLPARSGLGSSSSFTVGLLHALYALKQQMIEPRRLAEEAIDIEQNYLQESVGIQDQIMAAHGGFKIIEMGPSSNWNVKNMLLPSDYISELGENVLLGFSGISRMAEQHAKNKVENIKKGATTKELHTINAITGEALQAFKKLADFDEIGHFLNKSWECKKRLADGISADWMDDLYKTAIQNGAFGGKLMGAGGGGFFFFLAPPKKHKKIRDALSQIKVWVPFNIDRQGSQVIFYNEK